MKTLNIVRNIIASGLVLVASHASFAMTKSDIVCPTTEELKTFQVIGAAPYDFDSQSQKAKFFIDAGQEVDFSSDLKGIWFLSSISVKAGQSDDIQEVVQTILEQLTPVSPIPFQYEIDEFDGMRLEHPVCVYTLPGDKSTNAMATYIGFTDDEDDNDDDDSDSSHEAKKQAKIARYQQHMNLIKRHLSHQ